jgi:hypothetical protein
MARNALAAGADFTAPRGGVAAFGLAGDYRVRMNTTAAKGIATVGLTEAVSALDAAGAARVAIGDIGGPSDRWHFIVFVNHDSGRLLACTGVERAAV